MRSEPEREFLEFVKYSFSSKVGELKTRLAAISGSSFIPNELKNNIALLIERLDELKHKIDKSSGNVTTDLEELDKLRRDVNEIEDKFDAVEGVIETFAEYRELSTALSNLLGSMYEACTGKRVPVYICISRKMDELETLPSFWMEEGTIGIVRIPVYALDDIQEWILATHELGHIILQSMEKAEYTMNSRHNILLELKADSIALKLIGPVYLEALMLRRAGRGREVDVYHTHPPDGWRIVLLYWLFSTHHFMYSSETFAEARKIGDVINRIYEKGIKRKIKLATGGELAYVDVQDEIYEWWGDAIKKIGVSRKEVEEKYKKAKEIAGSWIEGEFVRPDERYSKDVLVIAGYLASKRNPSYTNFYTQKVTEFLL